VMVAKGEKRLSLPVYIIGIVNKTIYL